MDMGKKHFPFYGALEYLDPAEYFGTDDWQYESTEYSSDNTCWDIVSRKDYYKYDCRYTSVERS